MEEFKSTGLTEKQKEKAEQTANSLIQGPDGIMRTPEDEKQRIEDLQNER